MSSPGPTNFAECISWNLEKSSLHLRGILLFSEVWTSQSHRGAQKCPTPEYSDCMSFCTPRSSSLLRTKAVTATSHDLLLNLNHILFLLADKSLIPRVFSWKGKHLPVI